MTIQTYTAEEVREIASALDCDTGREYAHIDAAMDAGRECCDAYAADLDRRAERVTDEIANTATSIYLEYPRKELNEGTEDVDAMRAALTAVWPVAAEPAQREVHMDRMIGTPAYPDAATDPFNKLMSQPAALAAQGQGGISDKHERELGQLIDERDRREEIIDCLCDAVLGQGRPEWSSAYGYDDALLEVQEAMFSPHSAQPVMTQDQIVRHQIAASDCPPDSKVLLVSSVQRLLAAASPAGVPDG